jgi:hypothetical protein
MRPLQNMVGNGKGLFLSIPFTIDLMLAGSPVTKRRARYPDTAWR